MTYSPKTESFVLGAIVVALASAFIVYGVFKHENKPDPSPEICKAKVLRTLLDHKIQAPTILCRRVGPSTACDVSWRIGKERQLSHAVCADGVEYIRWR